MTVGVRSRRTALVPCRTAGLAKVTSSVLPPVASVTTELTPSFSMLIVESMKLTEYIVEPLGRFADANVWEMFCSFRRSTVAGLIFGVIETTCGATWPFWLVMVLVIVVVEVVLVPVTVLVMVLVVVLGSVTSRLMDAKVRLSEVVPTGTIGGSVSWTIRTDEAPWIEVVPDCWL